MSTATAAALQQVLQGGTVNAPDINQLVQAFQGAYLVNGPLVQVQTQIITTTAATVTFSNIPQFNNLFLAWSARSTNASATVNLLARINGDSSANYFDARVFGFNSGANSDFTSGGTAMRLGEIAAASAAGAANVGGGFAVIPAWGQTANQLTGFSISGYAVNVGATGSAAEAYTFSYGVTPSTNSSLTLLPSAGSFAGTVAPCEFTLYGSM